jgi:hypothetical protein
VLHEKLNDYEKKSREENHPIGASGTRIHLGVGSTHGKWQGQVEEACKCWCSRDEEDK